MRFRQNALPEGGESGGNRPAGPRGPQSPRKPSVSGGCDRARLSTALRSLDLAAGSTLLAANGPSAPSVVSLDDPAALDPTLAGPRRRTSPPLAPPVSLRFRASCSPQAGRPTSRPLQSGHGASSRRTLRRRSSSARRRRARTAASRRWPACSSRSSTSPTRRRFLDAVDVVIASAEAAKDAGLVDADMAVLVQPMLDARFGGVLFGADPTTGRTDRLLLAAVAGNPSALVSGEVEGWTAVLDRRGKVRDVRSGGDVDRPPAAVIRQLAEAVARRRRTYGGAAGHRVGRRRRRQRCTCCRPARSPRCRPRQGRSTGRVRSPSRSPSRCRRSSRTCGWRRCATASARRLRLTGTMPPKALAAARAGRSPSTEWPPPTSRRSVSTPPPDGMLRKLDPRPPARRLRAAWRVGRLRSAFADLATDVVHRVDADLMAVPALGHADQPRAARRAAQRPPRAAPACTDTRRSPGC